MVRALRLAGHDVLAVTEVSPGSEDQVVIDLSVHESRIPLTEDKDFGQLVYASGRPATGVLFIRFPGKARETLCRVVLDLVRKKGDQMIGRFVVVQPGRIRIGSVPQGEGSERSD